MKVVEPSLLAFDPNNLDSQLEQIKTAGATFIHYDVMDGIYVPNVAFGPEQLLNVKKNGLSNNVHMMVKDPMMWIKKFYDFPINSLTFHPEIISLDECNDAFALLQSKGIKYGIAIKPNIDANQYLPILKKCDYVCVMSVVPGKGGQTFMSESIDNLVKVKNIKDSFNNKLIIQLDGGVNFEVMQKTKKYVDHFIIGSFLMKQEDKKTVFDFLKTL